jgi:hypothetical protein
VRHDHALAVRIQISNSSIFPDTAPRPRRTFARVLPERPALDIRGRRECRAPGAPAASCAKVESTRVRNHGHTGTPGIPYAMVLTVSFVLFPATGLFATVVERNFFRQLDASIGASEPHDFAVRRPGTFVSAPPASTASRLTSVTIAKRPSEGRDSEGYGCDLGEKRTRIFLERGLDGANRIDPVQQFRRERKSMGR